MSFDNDLERAKQLTVQEVMMGDPGTVKLISMILPIIEQSPSACHAHTYAVLYGTLLVELSRIVGCPVSFERNLQLFEVFARTIYEAGMLEVFGTPLPLKPKKPGTLLHFASQEPDDATQSLLLDLPGDAYPDEGA